MRTIFGKQIFTLMLLLLASPVAVSAQGVLDGILEKAGKALGGESGTSIVSDIANAIIGTKKVDKSTLVGTWAYSAPALVFESDNVANKLGGSVLSKKGETLIDNALRKHGIAPGSVKLTFKEDDTYTCQIGNRKTSGKYSVDGSTLTLTALGKTALKANVKITGKELQLAVDADKLLTMANTLGAAASKVSSTASTLTTFMKSYKGMKLGMKFKR